ncbi:MAG: hypothetical protein COA44_00725 [Arcobacter sp.]|nr:MAG: hypothetical protein COA44_00725 [Arcobacter sp.]
MDSNITKNMEADEESFDIQQALYIIKKYNKSIAFIVVVFIIISGIMAYFKPSMYFSTAVVQISEKGRSGWNDPVLTALGLGDSQGQNIDSIMSSGYLISKMLENLELGTRYYKEKNYRLVELYKKSPLVVNVTFMEYNLLEKKLKIRAIDGETYELSYKTKIKINIDYFTRLLFGKQKVYIEYKGIHKFGEDVISKYFQLKVIKVRELNSLEYFFSYIDNRNMVGYIQNNLSTEQDAKYSSNIFVRFDDTVALRAKDIVDGITTAYIQDSVDQKKSSTERSLAFIDKQLDNINKTLSKSEKVLQGFKQKNNLLSLDIKAAMVSKNVEKIGTEISSLSSEESILENLKEYIDENDDLTGLTVQSLETTATNLNELIINYQTALTNRRSMLVSVTEFHPEVIKLNEEVFNLRKNIQATVVLGIKTIKTRKEYLRRELKVRQASLTKLPEQERELGELTRNSSVNQEIYSFLLKRRVETAILNSSTLSQARLMDPATLPMRPYAPKKMRMLLMGALLGLIIGVIIAFIRASINNVISNIEEIEKRSPIPIYGKIPYNKKKVQATSYEEAFRILRTNLEFINTDKPSKTVLVASSISGEGKSTTIKNMAVMLVKLNKKVIVLDLDLRRPSLHKYFKGITNDIGLSMLLSGQNNLQECLQRTKDNIEIISAGPTPPNPSELIMSEEMDLLLKTLSKSYDYILIDTPPYSIVTDATILMKKVDIVLFSIMADYSSRKCIPQLKEILKNYQIEFAGIIYHGIKLKRQEKHGYGYY